MPLLQSPKHPYVSDCPNPYTIELEEARQLFLREIDNTTGWEGEMNMIDYRLAGTLMFIV